MKTAFTLSNECFDVDFIFVNDQILLIYSDGHGLKYYEYAEAYMIAVSLIEDDYVVDNVSNLRLLTSLAREQEEALKESARLADERDAKWAAQQQYDEEVRDYLQREIDDMHD
jgi:hypothetical protein